MTKSTHKSMNQQQIDNIHWSENVIIADADYIDRVAFDLIVNFERMFDRRIPAADMSRWAMDIALDGGLREGDHETQIVLLHDKDKGKLQNFAPADYDKELNGKAFRDERLGEFIVNNHCRRRRNKRQGRYHHGHPRHNPRTQGGEEDNGRPRLRADRHLADAYHNAKPRRRRREAHYTLRHAAHAGGNFRQQILGYSLMNAMGITQKEIDKKIR